MTEREKIEIEKDVTIDLMKDFCLEKIDNNKNAELGDLIDAMSEFKEELNNVFIERFYTLMRRLRKLEKEEAVKEEQ